MAYTPTWYQSEDSDAMLETEHAFLWQDAGTGKTVTALEAFRKGDYKRGVIFCPKIALTMWFEEIEKHLGLKAWVLRTGSLNKKSAGMILNGDVSFVITTFDLARKHEHLINAFVHGRTTLMTKSWTQLGDGDELQTVLILDEAHLLKSKDTQRTKSIFGINCNQASGIMSGFTDVWQLTGTPIMRHADDLWTQLMAGRRDVLAHYGLTTYDKFVDKFCVTALRQYHPRGPYHKVVVGSKNNDELNVLLKQCGVLQRRLKDVVDSLPEITYSTIETSYKGVPSIPIDMNTLLRELNKPDSEMAKVRRQLGMAKAIDVADYAAEYGRTPLLIGFWHRDVCDILCDQLAANKPNWVIEIVHGGTSSSKRDAIQKKFNNGELDAVIGQMQAMNSSWNLQEACSHVIIAEELPSPAMVHQFVSRVHRKGQVNRVHVDVMMSEHGLDKAMRDLRNIKAANNEEILA